MASEKELLDKIAELEATVVHQRKRADTAETFICTMCAECKWEVHDGILVMQKACCSWFPECHKFNLRPGWIPVTERLPEDLPENKGKKVINCIVAHSPYANGKLTSQFRQRKWDKYYDGWYWSKIGGCTVTHWMPLPEPPKEVE